MIHWLFQTTEVPEIWEHDMFQDDAPPRVNSRPAAVRKAARLIITNLDFGVNDDDIRVRICCISLSAYVTG